MKERTKGFLAGMLVMLLIVSFSVTAFAAYRKNATLEYADIKITLDGQEVVPRDVNGNAVEPFIINGTTYLPVRGISSSLGLAVDWDQTSKTVMLETKSRDVFSDLVDQSVAYTYAEEGVQDIGMFYTTLCFQDNCIYGIYYGQYSEISSCLRGSYTSSGDKLTVTSSWNGREQSTEVYGVKETPTGFQLTCLSGEGLLLGSSGGTVNFYMDQEITADECRWKCVTYFTPIEP